MFPPLKKCTAQNVLNFEVWLYFSHSRLITISKRKAVISKSPNERKGIREMGEMETDIRLVLKPQFRTTASYIKVSG